MHTPTTQLKSLALGLFLFSCIEASQAKDDAEMQALLELLEEETEIATHTKLNADFVPGSVSVLHGEHLRSYGYRDVGSALNAVAGFYISVNNSEDYVPIIRGVGASLSGNNIKILLDGVPLNRATDGSAEWALRMPLAQVERLEVIRGPGSALYGEFAFSSVINIVTNTQNTVNTLIGEHELIQTDLLFTHQLGNDYQISANASLWRKDRSGRQTYEDTFASRGFGHSPGNIYDDAQGAYIKATLESPTFNIHALYADAERGAGYGENAALPFATRPRSEKVSLLNAEKNWVLSDYLDIALHAGLHKTRLEQAEYLPIPAGVDPPGPPTPEPDDRFIQDVNEDYSYRALIEGGYSGFENHRLFAQLAFSHSEVNLSHKYFTVNGQRMLAPSDVSLVTEGARRTIYSLTLQDQWAVAPNFDVTAGFRFDEYSDWGLKVSPRLATVWRFNENHLFKAQYTEAFRPPTLADRNPGENAFPVANINPLNEELIYSTELGYIYRRARRVIRTTVYENRIEDLIEFYLRPGDPPQWRNRGDITVRGAELEYQETLNSRLSWAMNFSYADAMDGLDQQDDKLVGAVSWLANASVQWQVSPNFAQTLSWRYIGQQEGWDLNLRAPLAREYDAVQLVNYSFKLDKAFNFSGWQVSAGINNIGNKKYDVLPNPAQHSNGLPVGERHWWLQLMIAY